MRLSGGTIEVAGSVGFCGEEPLLYADTLRENILFGAPYLEDLYAETCRLCCLDTDFAAMPLGDATVIGEKGISLSGGQKARVSLARAVYARPDVFLLDNVLGALDRKVGVRVMENCLRGRLESALRVVVLN